MPEYRIEVPLRTQALKYHNPLVLAQDGAALEATDKLSRNYWIISKVYGDGHYDVQKESARVYEFNYHLGVVGVGSDTFEDQTKYEHVFCIIPRAVKYLGVGDVVKLGFYNNNKNKPFIKQIIKSFMARGVAASAGPSIEVGIWDQTWRSYYQDARSNTTTAPADLSFDDAWSYDSDADGGGLHWAPDGLLIHKSGRVLHLSRWTDIAESGFDALELRVRLLIASSPPYATQASAALELVGPEQTASWLLPDGTAFYNATDDVLTVLVAPSQDTWTDEAARIWTLQPNEDLDEFVSALSSFELGSEGERRSWGTVGQAGRQMIRMDLPLNEMAGYVLDLETLEWSQEWTSSPLTGTLGSHFAAPGMVSEGAKRNYSPPWHGAKFFTLVTVREGSGESPNWSNYRLRELAISETDGAVSEIDIYSWDSVDRSDPTQLSICDDYADSWLASLQASADVRVPATGTYDEFDSTTNTSSQSNGLPPSDPLYESWTFEWVVKTTRRWLGAIYENYTHSWESGGDLYNYDMNFPVPNSGEVEQSGLLTNDVGGVPLGPPGTPLPYPNRAWWGRAFWTGQGGTFGDVESVPWNTLDVDQTGGNLPYSAVMHNREAHARGIATSDGWRFWVAVVPDQPVFVPNTLAKDGTYDPVGPHIVDNTFNDLVLVQKVTATGTLGNTYESYQRGEQRYLGGVVPVVRWTWQTRLFALSPTNEVFERELSGRWEGLPYPGRLVGGEPEALEIEEELAVAENCYQIFTVPRHNLLGILLDQRTSGTAEPEPMVLLLDRTDNTFDEVYRIPASDFYPESALDIVDADAEYDGQFWKRVGQYAYTLHGHDESGPLCKVIERADETLLLIGTESVKRVEPSTGTAGDTLSNLSLLRLNAEDYDGLGGVGSTTAWTWGTSREGVGHLGPRGVRSAAVMSDRIVVGAQLSSSPGIKEIV